MKHKCLFLEGDMQIGKSTNILKTIKSTIPHNLIGGFMCQRLVHNEETIAFCLTSFDKVEAATIEYSSDVPNVFLENVSGKWIRNEEVFNKVGIEILSNISSKRLIVLDEIGGFELLVGQFRAKLYKVLSKDIPVIGVIKSNKNKLIMKKAIEINDEYIALHQKLCIDIENIFKGKILSANKNNMLYVKNEINMFLEEL